MCGIAGIIDFRGRPIERAVLESFCGSLGHRGPDDAGIWQYHSGGFSAGLAHTRLAVIDPTPEAHQPMLDASGRYAVSYNGELYNFRELREQLPLRPRTASDTEVVLNACIAWGTEVLARFDAMWALAFVDTVSRTGHLSRDPFGIKPLYYLYHDNRLIFASELSAIRRVTGIPTEIDRDAIALYLHLSFIPHPYTAYRHIRKLPPGHVLPFDANGPGEPRRYHHIASPLRDDSQEAIASGLPPAYEEACHQLRARIQSAVLRQTVADVPVGAFLSGGLDSSIVVASLAAGDDALSPRSPALAAKRSPRGAEILNERVKTFSIGYADHPRYDETNYARLVADHFHTDHHEFRLTFRDIIDVVEPMLNHLGEPFADSSLLPTSLVSRYTRQHVTVALSGDGGDELFGGYWRYLGHHYIEQYQKVPALLRKAVIEPLLRVAPSARSTRWLNRVRQVQKLLRAEKLPDAMARHLAWAKILDERTAAALLGPDRAARASGSLERLYRGAARDLLSTYLTHPLAEILLADLAVTLPADMLFKVDTASMYHSLEIRVPLLSSDIVDFVTGLPAEYKIAGSTGKRILKDAFRSVLPEAIVNRGKMGFEVPVGEFLRRELREMYHATVTPGVLGDLGIDAPAAERLYAEHAARRSDHAELLWSLLVLCHWYRQQ